MNKTSQIARGGLLTAITVILLYVTNLIPTSRLSILTIASAVIPLAIMTIGVKYSAVVYAASSLLAVALNLRGAALAYIVFFGLYGFVKYYLEGLRKHVIEFIFKFVYFNISLFILYNFYNVLFVNNKLDKFPIYILVLLSQIVFIVYDYVLTSIVAYTRKKLIKQ